MSSGVINQHAQPSSEDGWSCDAWYWDPSFTADSYRPSKLFVKRYGRVVPFEVGRGWCVRTERQWAWSMSRPDDTREFVLWCPVALVDSLDWRQLLRTGEMQLLFDMAQATSASRNMEPSSSATLIHITISATLPPELFKRICGEVDDAQAARTFRLVCRYWDQRCRPQAFEKVWLRRRAQRVLDLSRFPGKVAWRHIPALVQCVWGIPDYDSKSPAPWLHLLDPRWTRETEFKICGPFRGGHRTIRSVHFALPRSLPRSFSHRFKKVCLIRIHFRQWTDTTRLVCDLPDLEDIRFVEVTWGSLPRDVEPARRRPRTDRNKLERVTVLNCKDVAPWQAAVACLSLYLSVYSPTSFFPDDSIAALAALSPVTLTMMPLVSPTPLVWPVIGCFADRYLAIWLDSFVFFGMRVDPSTGTYTLDARFTSDWETLARVEDWVRLRNALLNLTPLPQLCVSCKSEDENVKWAHTVGENWFSLLSARGLLSYAIAETIGASTFRA